MKIEIIKKKVAKNMDATTHTFKNHWCWSTHGILTNEIFLHLVLIILVFKNWIWYYWISIVILRLSTIRQNLFNEAKMSWHVHFFRKLIIFWLPKAQVKYLMLIFHLELELYILHFLYINGEAFFAFSSLTLVLDKYLTLKKPVFWSDIKGDGRNQPG